MEPEGSRDEGIVIGLGNAKQKEKWLFEAIPNCRLKDRIDPGTSHCGESRSPDPNWKASSHRPIAVASLFLPPATTIRIVAIEQKVTSHRSAAGDRLR